MERRRKNAKAAQGRAGAVRYHIKCDGCAGALRCVGSFALLSAARRGQSGAHGARLGKWVGAVGTKAADFLLDGGALNTNRVSSSSEDAPSRLATNVRRVRGAGSWPARQHCVAGPHRGAAASCEEAASLCLLRVLLVPLLEHLLDLLQLQGSLCRGVAGWAGRVCTECTHSATTRWVLAVHVGRPAPYTLGRHPKP